MEIADVIRDIEIAKLKLASDTMTYAAGAEVNRLWVQIGTYRGLELALGLIRKGLEQGEQGDTLGASLKHQEKGKK